MGISPINNRVSTRPADEIDELIEEADLVTENILSDVEDDSTTEEVREPKPKASIFKK